ncbi:MAG: alanine racemase [Candidatus Marinimicrobia bacterium]|nr:alanine racemase [Candidatus Neomarinimicrobiota bacterium]
MHALESERNWIEISLDHFIENLRELRRFMPKEASFMQIVKADAYGHGAVEIAQVAIQEGASMVGVANAEEGKLLRLHGIDVPILILSPSLLEEIPSLLKYDLMPTVTERRFGKILGDVAKEKGKCVPIHVNIDTGMGRSGVNYEDSESFIADIQKIEGIYLDGIFTHYAASENDPAYSSVQLTRFKEFLSRLSELPRWIHIANSSGLLNCPDDVSNLFRIGLLSYGVYTDVSLSEKVHVKPVMTFKSRVSYVNLVRKGESVGYNRTYIAPKETRYAIVPVGYADGYDYLLSNKGTMLVHNILCPVIGKVSMDMTAIDVSSVTGIQPGDEVIVFGNDHREIRVDTLCQTYGGSPYELLCQTGRRARRFYFQKERIIKARPLARREFVSSDYDSGELSKVIEGAIGEKIGNREIARLIFSTVLQRLFQEESRPLFHRHEFYHRLSFSQPKDEKLAEEYFQIDTELSFKKHLQNDYFIIACASNEKELEAYFRREDVEYRWLLDGSLHLNDQTFAIRSVRVDDLDLNYESRVSETCLELTCTHEKLHQLVGKHVSFTINTRTYYPKASHQLTVYITGLTQGAEISVDYHQVVPSMDVIPFFLSGQPNIYREEGAIHLITPANEWLLPGSGVVFVF